MSSPHAPRRIADDPGHPLHGILGRARGDVLTPEQCSRAWSRLESAAGSSPQGAARPGHATSPGMFKWLVRGGATVGLAGLAFLGIQSMSAPRAPSSEGTTMEDRGGGGSVTFAAVAAVAPPPAGSSATAPQVVSAKTEAPRLKAPAPPSAASPGSEGALLLRARTVLDSNPAEALRLTAQHAREYPRSALSEERAVLEIGALKRLGRGAEATGAADRFREAHPGSAHLPHVERAVRAVGSAGP